MPSSPIEKKHDMVPLKLPDDRREFAFGDEEFQFLAKLANARTGIVLAQHKRDMVYGRLARRLRALDLPTFADYCELLRSPEGEDEISHLINAITTNLTSFFREAHHFEHLGKEVLAPLAANPPKRLRIWSAACSSGMEPYSIAMTLRHAIRDLKGCDARILASDIDSNMLQTGMAGEYNASELENIPREMHRLTRLSERVGKMHMTEELKQLIAFRRLNLMDAWPMKGPFDAIFCRNVVIYFDRPTKEKLFDRMADLLKPGGYLYIGHSETLHGICDRFELVGRTIYRRT